MFKDEEIQQVILYTLGELRQTIQDSSRETYSKEELIDLLGQVADVLLSGTTGGDRE